MKVPSAKKLLIFFVVLNILFVAIYIYLNKARSRCFIRSKIYGDVLCGDIYETSDEFKIAGILLRLYEKEGEVYLTLGLSNSFFSNKADFLLGKMDTSYIFVNEFENEYDDYRESKVFYSQKKLNLDTIKYLRDKKGKVIRIVIKKDLSPLLKVDPSEIEERFREDINFRKSYLSRCSFPLTKGKIRSDFSSPDCKVLFINAIEFVKK